MYYNDCTSYVPYHNLTKIHQLLLQREWIPPMTSSRPTQPDWFIHQPMNRLSRVTQKVPDLKTSSLVKWNLHGGKEGKNLSLEKTELPFLPSSGEKWVQQVWGKVGGRSRSRRALGWGLKGTGPHSCARRTSCLRGLLGTARSKAQSTWGHLSLGRLPSPPQPAPMMLRPGLISSHGRLGDTGTGHWEHTRDHLNAAAGRVWGLMSTQGQIHRHYSYCFTLYLIQASPHKPYEAITTDPLSQRITGS